MTEPVSVEQVAPNWRKKPVVVQAIRVPMRDDPDSGATVADLFDFMQPSEWVIGEDGLQITTFEGVMTAAPGDWIIRGVKGEHYPCKPDIFAATYERADAAASASVDEGLALQADDVLVRHLPPEKLGHPARSAAIAAMIEFARYRQPAAPSREGVLLALAERVEAYDPRQSLDNRADEMTLDLAIAKAVGVADDDWQVARGSVTGYFSGDGVGGFGNPTVERYTRSLDAARTLVPAGFMWRLQAWPDGVNSAILEKDAGDFGAVDARHTETFAVTLELALVGACLRARAATLSENSA